MDILCFFCSTYSYVPATNSIFLVILVVNRGACMWTRVVLPLYECLVILRDALVLGFSWQSSSVSNLLVVHVCTWQR